jgi:hypothetical protein
MQGSTMGRSTNVKPLKVLRPERARDLAAPGGEHDTMSNRCRQILAEADGAL